MRVSTGQYFANSAASYSNAFADTTKTQAQVSSGVRIQTAADDPVGAAKLLKLQQQQTLLTQYSGNMTSVTNSLTQEESVLDSVTTALQRAQELTIQAGNGGISDADRTSIAAEIDEIKENVYGLLNTKDANGNYLFSGSKTSTPPYARNSDGSFTYQGDQTQLSLQVSDTLSLATNDTGYAIFDQATNTSRTQTTQTLPVVNDNVVSVSAGRLDSLTTYDKAFTAGQPYTLEFTSSTTYTVKDKDQNDITSQLSGNGTFDPKSTGGTTVSIRGVEFAVNVTLPDTATTSTLADAAVKDHVYTLSTKADTVSSSRNPSNTSGAQITSGTVTNPTTYSGGFPSAGVVVKFTDANTYNVYAQPYSDSSKAIATSSVNTVTDTTVTPNVTTRSFDFAGVNFALSDAPTANDQFVVQANTNKTQNVLNTLAQLSTALKLPVTDQASQLALKNATDAALGNLAASSEKIDLTRGQIGARGNSLDIQNEENVSLGLSNKSTQSSIADTDLSTASIQLTLQQSMLEASQLAFAKISQLSLFSKL